LKLGKEIAKNTAAMLLATIIRMSASFILVVLVARKLGSTGMGEFSLILSLFWIFQTIASMGIQPLLIREIAAKPEKTGEIFSNAAFLSICASVLMAVCMVGFSVIAGYSHNIYLATYWMSATLVLSTVSIVVQAIFIAWEKAELVVVGMTWESAFRLGVGILVLLNGRGLIALCSVFAFSTIISLIINLFLVHKYITHFYFRIKWTVCKWLIRLVPTFAGISIFNTIFWHVGMVLMSKLTTIEQIGLYGASMRIATVIKLILQSYKVAIQPVAVKTFQQSMAAFKSFCERSLKYIFLLTIPICAGTFILSEQILELVFGSEFVGSAGILRIEVVILLAYGVTLVLATFLIASRNQKIDLRVNGVSMIVNMVLGYILISRFGILGAAISLLIAMHVFMFQQLHFITKNLFRLNILVDTMKIICASCMMAGLTWILSSIPVLLNILISAMFYIALLFLFRSLKHEDIRDFIQMRKVNN